jgi:hypothetical protein
MSKEAAALLIVGAFFVGLFAAGHALGNAYPLPGR